MNKTEEFIRHIADKNTIKGKSLLLGAAILDETVIPEAHVQIPIKTLNRHGIIAGATGTGKTKTLQVLSEHLSNEGIPVLLMDLKGDLSGIAAEGSNHPKIDERHQKIGIPYQTKKFPVELFTLSESSGVQLRATVSEFGPVLLSQILNVNETQAGIISIIFQYCDNNQLPLLDLKDLKKTLQFATNEGKEAFEKDYGRISKASAGAILRKIITLEQQGADLFFGEKSFEVKDFCRLDPNALGFINIIRLIDIQDKPKLFSAFMLCLLAEIYNTFEEQGDKDIPELVIFLDEAHLIFKNASNVLIDQIENIVKLIRSKGIGLYFVTQNPNDIPEAILSQLGLKVQHSLRAVTAKDRKAIKLVAENFPLSPYYNTKEVITSLGIGEALITALDEKGRPTPLLSTMLRAPMSRMDVLSNEEVDTLTNSSHLIEKYNSRIDRESAYEMLTKKIEAVKLEEKKSKDSQLEQGKTTKKRKKESLGTTEKAIIKVLTSATFIRGALGVLKKLIK